MSHTVTNPTASSGSLTNPFHCTARESDPETGLYHYRARYYDPSAGRFLSEDPIGFENDDDINLYTYAQNSPASLVDPFGLQHMPGGPWHPPDGVKFACKPGDSCSVLSAKIGIFQGLIVGHLVWDALNNQPGRHTEDVSSFIKGLGNCIRIHKAKCTNKQCPPEDTPVPVPAPEPQREPFRVPAPTPQAAANAIVGIGIVVIVIIAILGSPLGI
jgi:RHS repeat-associated protein